MAEPRFFGCNLCEAMCGLEVTLEDGKIAKIRGDPQDVFTHGHVCPKGLALKDLHEDPDRLRTPMRRTASGFEAIGWKEALDEAGSRLREIRKAHGRHAVAFYVGNPTVHSHRASLGVQALSLALRTHNLFNPNSQDSNPRLFACQQVYGDPLCVPVPDIDRTDFLLILGANPVVSNGSMWVLGDARGRLQSVRKRGGRIVLIDPRRNETAALCDEHHFIRPGSDAALLLAFIQVIFSEGLQTPRLSDIGSGAAELQRAASPYTPERVTAAVGIAPGEIRRLARELATTPRAVIYGRLGTCQNEFGPLASWLIEALNAITGHFDVEGGVMLPQPAADIGPLTRMLIPKTHGRWRSRVRGLPEFLDALPSAVMAEEMEVPGPGQIRALVTFAGDPVLSTPNGPRLAAAIEKLEFSVAIDLYLNETSRRADLVFPPTHVFESGNFELVLLGFTARNFVRYSPPIMTPPSGALDDWEILSELAVRVGGRGWRAMPWMWGAWGKRLPETVVNLLLRTGKHRLTLESLAVKPHGVDLGPLQSSRGQRVKTSDHKLRLAPAPLLADLGRLERWVDGRQETPKHLVLIGRRHLRSNNSWMHNLTALTRGPGRAQLLMHPLDASERSIPDKSRVRITSRVGSVEAEVRLTEDVFRGVVSLPHGFGHQGTLSVARGLGGPNVNALTDQDLVEPVLGTSILNGVPVEVSAVRGGSEP